MDPKSKMTLLLFVLFVVFSAAMPGLFAQDNGLNIGDQVPLFNANNQNGELWRLGDHINNKYIVLYFYPAALTGGCTKQACSYRDSKSTLDEIDAEIIGVSADPVNNLKIFGSMYNLNFTLLSDVNGEIAGIFGVPLGKGGSITREVDGTEMDLMRSHSVSRWTYIIDKQGKIVYKDTEVSVNEDSDRVIQFLKSAIKK